MELITSFCMLQIFNINPSNCFMNNLKTVSLPIGGLDQFTYSYLYAYFFFMFNSCMLMRNLFIHLSYDYCLILFTKKVLTVTSFNVDEFSCG